MNVLKRLLQQLPGVNMVSGLACPAIASSPSGTRHFVCKFIVSLPLAVSSKLDDDDMAFLYKLVDLDDDGRISFRVRPH